MTTAEQVLSILSARRGEFVSGEELAAGIEISRNAVWKAVNTLRGGGLEIDAVTNRGYRLISLDALTPGIVKKYMPPDLPLRVEVADSLESTNTELKARAQHGEKSGLALIAREQTGGKGRMGRSFFSPERSGLYMSLLLRPTLSAGDATLITVAAAVAVAKALEKLGACDVGIKWVNDIYVRGKKVCGILTEASIDIESGGLDYAVVGMGVNIRDPRGGFPPEIKDKAGSVFGCDSPDDARAKIAASILEFFWGYYVSLPDTGFISEYRSRDILKGREIDVIKPEGIYPAVALGIEGRCGLVVRYKDGGEETLRTGEVSIKLL